MKKVLCSALIFVSLSFQAQIYQSYNINLLSLSTPNNDTSGVDNRKYSGCWGWFQASKNKEYGISGTSNGTYFIDVTSPTNPIVCDFVAGKKRGTYREIKTYQNYCYIVSDDAPANKFQIIDMQYLPDSVHVVHNSDSIFPRGHTIWIDQDKLYVGAVTYTNGFSAMNVYSLANPKLPLLLKKLQQDIPFINYVHDMYVRNDTIYASCAEQGLYVFKFLSSTNTFTQLGSYTGYPTHGYNHSSALSKDGKHLLFCDEVPTSLPIHFVNVENLNNIQPVKDFHPEAQTTPHNPFVKDDFMLVSCYQDGLYIYDISQPNNLNLAGYFDTHPQGGANVSNYGTSGYRGNWGLYPFLPSGNIIANDMQNGMFVLNASAAYSTTIQNPVQISELKVNANSLIFYPNPASSQINIHSISAEKCLVKIENSLGQIVFEKNYNAQVNDHINLENLSNGVYLISLSGEKTEHIKKLIICH
jgi:choice-of-anchor B domain-containing protein